MVNGVALHVLHEMPGVAAAGDGPTDVERDVVHQVQALGELEGVRVLDALGALGALAQMQHQLGITVAFERFEDGVEL